MQISLRNANAIQRELASLISGLEQTPEFEVNGIENPLKDVDHRSKRWVLHREQADDIREALYGIRKSVSAANHVSGLNDVLADIAKTEESIKVTKRALEAKERPSSEYLMGAHNKLAEDKSESVYRMGAEIPTITYGLLTFEQREYLTEELADLRRTLHRLKDRSLQLNLNTLIDVAPATEEILRENRII
ncbi:hypothetical protein [Salipiger sp. PrR003]|uniref:hypothetical protein n=1 Tax=Salipiger sp. PrR003 TaxID=2706776 RepID=UPI0013DA33D2|nr:hypothetical protein [Salipiger sp. PrR003]NDV52276.1 hypothetical protein [Salipiger sp. PrR003]